MPPIVIQTQSYLPILKMIPDGSKVSRKHAYIDAPIGKRENNIRIGTRIVSGYNPNPNRNLYLQAFTMSDYESSVVQHTFVFRK